MSRDPEKEREYRNKYRAKHLAEGLCICCQNKRVTKNHCRKCADKACARLKEQKLWRKENGLCTDCNEPRVNKNHCEKHALYYRNYYRSRK